MKPGHRARILQLAASRNEKGFSSVVAEALEFFLQSQSRRAEVIRAALALKGSLRKRNTADLSTQTLKTRANWQRASPILNWRAIDKDIH
jgi:hypothetical protein